MRIHSLVPPFSSHPLTLSYNYEGPHVQVWEGVDPSNFACDCVVLEDAGLPGRKWVQSQANHN